MDTKFTGSSNYVASQDLMETVNIAVALQKPLLIKGEPGTGKTMLAQAVEMCIRDRCSGQRRRGRDGPEAG